MWRLIPFSVLITLLVAGVGLAYFLALQLFGGPFTPTFLIEYARPVALAYLLAVFLIGKYIWKFVWKTPKFGELLECYICPDLNGRWVGTIETNWAPPKGGPSPKTDMEIQVDADFFRIRLKLLAGSNKSTSHSLGETLVRDPINNEIKLWYMYRHESPQVVQGDSTHAGAAILGLKRHESNGLVMEGTYWTNRNWRSRENTAGSINLRKVD